MIRLFQEHPEFDSFTRFDTTTGRLETISEERFRSFLPAGYKDSGRYLERVAGRNGSTLFTGAQPETHVRFPRRLYFQITRSCNLNCPHCFIKAGRGQAHVPTEAIHRISEFMGAHGLMEVRLTGGEPTSHPDFPGIMRKFKEDGVYVSVATNGVWTPRIRDVLCEEPNLWVICSIDGGRSVHEHYRPGTFDTIVSSLRTLKERNSGARVRITTVLTKENKGQIMELGAICRSVGAESITVIPLRPQVRDPEVREEMVESFEFREVIEDLVEAQDRFGIPFTTTMETDYKDKVYRDPIVRKRSSCAAGREATNLDYDAATGEFQVYACSYSPASDLAAPGPLRQPFLAGTFTARTVPDFLRIWRKSEVWRIYRDLTIRSRKCQGCHYLRRHHCTGSCPIQNIDYDGIDVEGDVLAQLREQIQGTGEWYCYQKIDPVSEPASSGPVSPPTLP